MKKKDNLIFVALICISTVVSSFVYEPTFNDYPNEVEFVMWWLMCALVLLPVLFNNNLNKFLYDKKDMTYSTLLHKLRDYYKHLIIFVSISTILIIVLPTTSYEVSGFIIGKFLLIVPVQIGAIYDFYKIASLMLY